MGKGDKKTKRGKIANGTFGVSRPRPSASDKAASEKKKEKPEKPAKRKSSKK